MPFNIRAGLLNKLPTSEQGSADEVGQTLYDAQGGLCNLCAGAMNIASEVLQADHDLPESEGGPTTLANLRLTHVECNKSKRNLSTEQVRPYLKLRRFVRDRGGRVKYDSITEHFDIEPLPSKVEILGESISIQFGDSSSTSAPVYSDTVNGGVVRYAFIRVPRVALFNDADVQPRNVRYDHAFLIYQDMLRNPLHEPPACRLGPPDSSGLQQLLMFDGQHKTIANWMLQRDNVAVKLYLDLDKQSAVFLVNSIQSKIKKLPLSAFEIAAKMDDEFQGKVEEYEAWCAESGETASEYGFIHWVPAGQERNRAKQAFKSALEQRVLSHPNFHLRDYVDSDPALTETMVKSKVVDVMVSFNPLKDAFFDSTNKREEEVENIVWMWNLLVDELASVGEGSAPPQSVVEGARDRLFKQESLRYVSWLLREFYVRRAVFTRENALFGTAEGHARDEIESGIRNICAHPVWTAELTRDDGMKAVADALSKNQGGDDAFSRVALDLSTPMMGKDAPTYKAYWRKQH